jgi:hypothetical protein
MPPTTTESATRATTPGVYRAFDGTIDSVNNDDMTLVARINTGSKDRYNTVICPKGVTFRNYEALKRPVLWEHGRDVRRNTDPIAQAIWIRHNGGENPREILAKPRFLKDDFSRQRWEWYRDGVLNAFSINVVPDASVSGPPTREEVRANPGWEGADHIYRSTDLIEFSGTVLPGQPEALQVPERAARLMQAVERGLWLPDEIRPAIEECARTMTTVTESSTMQERYIRKQGEKWVVYSEAGKELGSHDSEEDAKKQLAAIEANKHKDGEGRSIPWIEDGHGVWIVRAADGSAILSTPDEAVAAQCFGLVNQAVTTTFESAYHRVIQENRTMFSEFRDDIQALVDLMLHGKV